MSQTYVPGGSVRDLIRLELSDQIVGAMVLEDEDYDALIAAYPDVEAKARAAESIGAWYARKADEVTDDDVKVSYKQRAQYYAQLAKTARESGQNPDTTRAAAVLVKGTAVTGLL